MAYATYYERRLSGEYQIHFKMGNSVHVMSQDEALIFLRSGMETLLLSVRQQVTENQNAQQGVHPTVATVAPPEVESTTRNSG